MLLRHGNFKEVGFDQEKIAQIDEVIKKSIQENITPGAVVLVSKNGIIAKLAAFGEAQKFDMGLALKKPRAMSISSIFDLASVTKVMATTQGIMKLVYEDKLSVKDKVIQFIPEFGLYGKTNITIEDLLTHSSGMVAWKPTYYHVSNAKEALNYICNLPLIYKTGTERRYSDFSFMLLGFIIEKMTGQKLNIYLESEIYKKLNMHDTSFLPSQELRERIAATSWGNPYEYRMVLTGTPYPCDENVEDFKKWRHYTLIGEVNDGNCFYANGGIAGHAGLFSTVTDLAILGQLMLNGGSYDNVKLYNESILKEFTKPQRFGQGYGFDIDDQGAFGHHGFTGTHVKFDKKNNLQIILLTNKQNKGLKHDGSYANTLGLNKEICDRVYAAMFPL